MAPEAAAGARVRARRTRIGSVGSRSLKNEVSVRTGVGACACGRGVAENQRRTDAAVAPGDVDIVVLSHLHFDHAGGATRRDDADHIVPTFPSARYFINRLEWEDATSRAAELSGAYVADDFRPPEEAGQLELTDGDVEITGGLSTQVIGGHTRGHQLIRFDSEGQTAVYLADLCPMKAHLRAQWCMAYDVDLLTSRRTKPEVLGRATDEGWLVLLDHDTETAAARLARDERREFAVVESFERL